MKQCYIPKNFKPETLRLVRFISDIVDEYQEQGYVLTVRQLYYQLVARDIIPNTLQSYKTTAGIINDAKHAGLLDWDMLEDRTREFVKNARWDSASELLGICAQQFHMDLWEDQNHRPFVIIEKEALSGVFVPVCRELDVPMLAARGYPSGSVLRSFAVTDMRDALRAGQVPVILHFGDHDPSGIDMTRDLQERLTMYLERHVEVRRLALNMQQVEEQRPPENPAKSADPRFGWYAEQFGYSSWELDALSPTYLGDLVRTNIAEYTDSDLLDQRKEEIEETRRRLKEVAESFEE